MASSRNARLEQPPVVDGLALQQLDLQDNDESLIQQLCALLEEYKLNYEGAEVTLDLVNAQLEAVYAEKNELEALVQYSDIYMGEMEESLQALDRELARAQANCIKKDSEIGSMRRLVSDYETKEKRRSEVIEESEMAFLRRERARLLQVTVEQDGELDRYEALIGEQQASILDLSLQVKLLESEAVNYRRLIKASTPYKGQQQRARRPPPLEPRPQPVTSDADAGDEGIGVHGVLLSLQLPLEDKLTRSSRSNTPKSKKERSPVAAQKWSEIKKHRGLFRQLDVTGNVRDSGDSGEARRHRWTAVMANGSLGALLPPLPPTCVEASAKNVAALSGKSCKDADEELDQFASEGSRTSTPRGSVHEGAKKQSLARKARDIYHRAKEALMMRRREFEGYHKEKKGDEEEEWSASALSVSSQSCGEFSQGRRRPQASSRRGSGSSVVPIDV